MTLFVFRLCSPRFPGSPSCRCRPCSTARGGSTPAILDKGLDQKALKPNFQHYHHKARAGRMSSSLSSSSQLFVFDILVIINALPSFLSLSCLIIDHHHHLHLWIDPRGSERWRSPRAGRRCTRIEHRPRSGQDQVNSKQVQVNMGKPSVKRMFTFESPNPQFGQRLDDCDHVIMMAFMIMKNIMLMIMIVMVIVAMQVV